MFDFVGDLIGGAFDYFGQKATNSANRQLAKENRDWQEHMSNTAYRRSMRDMKKSGLNPILAYQQGGASTPPGGVIPMENPAKNAGSVGRNVADHLLAARRLKAEIQNLNSATALNVEKSNTERSTQQTNAASAAYTTAQTQTEALRPGLVSADINLREADKNLRIQEEQTEFWRSIVTMDQVPEQKARAAVGRINEAINNGTFGPLLVTLERLGISPAALGAVLARKIPGFSMPSAPTSGNSPKFDYPPGGMKDITPYDLLLPKP